MRDIPRHGFPVEYRSLPCFRDLSVREVRQVWSLGEQVRIPDSWSLILDRGAEDSVYLILSGAMHVQDTGGANSERGPGELLSEVDPVAPVSRTAILSATSEVQALLFQMADFRTACAEVEAFDSAIRRTETAREGSQSRPS